jgi:type IV secretory pathway VirB10-like protein
MGLNMAAEAGRVSLAKWQLGSLIGLVVLATGASGTVVWKMAQAEPRQAAPRLTPDEARLLAKAEEEKARQQAAGKRLKQSELGAGYQIDGEGNLTGPSEGGDLPANKSLDEVGGGGAEAIARGIKGRRRLAMQDQEEDMPTERFEAPRREEGEEKVQRSDLEKPMLGYSTVKNARWAARHPETGEGGEGAEKLATRDSSLERNLADSEKRLAALQGMPSPIAGGPSPIGAGPSKNGDELMPAEERAQPFNAGGVGDMRIGGSIGPDQVVRQGKFLDCVLVNQIRADLVDSPVIGMVSRDFVSLDGQYVLVPAGSKVIGMAGKTQNLQQARVYMKFDRVIFPDQRSAYFPVRRLPAVDGQGAVGIDGDVDRHFMLMFGSAVMLGLLDGLAAAVEGANYSATPTTRELIMARTSTNMSQVVAGIIQRYGNVVPTITVEAGSKMKVFFAEDVRISPYMHSRDLSWVRHGR